MDQRKDNSSDRRLKVNRIGILLISLAIIFPVVAGIVRANAHKAETRRTAFELQHAITNFFPEYSRYPTRDPRSSYEGIHLSDNDFMAILDGNEEGARSSLLNPRIIAFYSFKQISTTTRPDGTHDIFDLWGHHYRIIVDTNGDDQITPPVWTRQKAPIRQSVIVWSPGPDGQDETAKDNITSW